MVCVECHLSDGTILGPPPADIGRPNDGPSLGEAIIGYIYGFSDPNLYSKGGKQQGRNYITDQARTEGRAMGMDPCAYYKWLKEQPGYKGNSKKIRDIEQAEKYDGCRNKQKRRSHYDSQCE
jgi:hypothetical protein